MAVPTSDLEWVTYLTQILTREKAKLKPFNDEYEMKSPRAYMHPEITAELGERLEQVIIAWPALVVDAIEERLDPEGFRLAGQDKADDELWRIWQANNLDEESQLGRVDALVMKRSYLAVGTNEDDDDTPLVTAESPLEVYADVDPRTRRVRAALRLYEDPGDLLRPLEEFSTLYLPNKTVHYERKNGWTPTHVDEHGLGVVPVVPLVNRARLSDRYGASELSPILPLSHAANKLASDMMVAAEFVALPLRGFLGLKPSDLEDEAGNPITPMQAILSRLLMIPADGDAASIAKSFEFAAADLKNFHNSINQLAQLVASLSGLPASFLGLTTVNPPSADAWRAAETRLVKRAERKQTAFGGTYEQTARLVRRFVDGDWDPKFRRLEMIWRDASTPTVAQMADAAVKKYTTSPRPIVPLRQTREDLRYTDGQIKRMELEDAAADRADPVRTIVEGMAGGGPVQANTPPPQPQPQPQPEPEPAGVG